MDSLRLRKNSDPENFTQGGGRAAGVATGGGRAARGAIGDGRGGNNNIPRVGGPSIPGDANLDMRRIEEVTKGTEDAGNGRKKKKKKKNRANDNTNVKFSWMRPENNR